MPVGIIYEKTPIGPIGPAETQSSLISENHWGAKGVCRSQQSRPPVATAQRQGRGARKIDIFAIFMDNAKQICHKNSPERPIWANLMWTFDS
jgi:hypothetical protein